MKKKIFHILLILVLISLILSACLPEPNLNRSWSTATPKAGSASTGAQPVSGAVPSVQNTPVSAAQTSGASGEKLTDITPAAAGSTEIATLPPETILIGEDEANPPFMYADANGQATGLYVELTKTALERMGMTPQFQALPWKRVLEASAKGEMGVAGIYKNDERLKIYDYSEPLFSERILIYVAKGKAFDFKSVADLKGKTIGVMTGWSYGNDFDQAKAAGEFTVQEAPGDGENLEKLVLGRVDCVLAAEVSAIPVIQEKGYADKVETLLEPMTVNDTYLIFAKSTNRVEFLKVFNATLAAMKQDGAYGQLIKKWTGVDVETTAAPAAATLPPETILIGEDEANPPFMYADANGQATGLYVELTKTALERMGMTPQFQALPWKRVLEASAKGEMGVAGIYKNDERLKIYDYSNPLFSERIMIYVAKGKAFDFKSVADLKGKTIGVMTGWSYGNDFDQAKAAGEFTVQEAPGDGENLEKLVLGRLDCVLAAEVSAIPVIQEKGYEQKVETLPAPLTVNDTYLIFAKSTNRVEFLTVFNATLAAMKQDGAYGQLVKKWTGVDVETTAAPAAATLPPETILIGEDEANPPFMYADANGQATGLYVELTKTALERMGMTPQFQALPWKRVLEASAKGEMGVAGIYKNDERLKIYDYSEPLYSERILIYVAKGKAFDFKSVADLKGKTIGVMTGWSYGNDFDQAKAAGEFTVQEAPGDGENLEKLVLGRLDCVLAAEVSAIPVINEKGYADKVEALPQPLTVNDTYLIFAKTVNRVEFLAIFNATLAAMKLDGSYDQLIEKWIGKGQ